MEAKLLLSLVVFLGGSFLHSCVVSAETLRGGSFTSEGTPSEEHEANNNNMIVLPLWSAHQIEERRRRRRRRVLEEDSSTGDEEDEDLEVETVTAVKESSSSSDHSASSNSTTSDSQDDILVAPAIEDEMLIPLFPGLGTHMAEVYIGSKKEQQTLIVDTGSSVTALPCTGCVDCGQDGSHIDNLFNPKKSKTFSKNKCGSCKLGGHCSSSGNNECHVSLWYAEGSGWRSYEVQDVIRFAEDAPDVPATYFGCQTKVTGLFRTQLADGILGMGTLDSSYWNQAVATGQLSHGSFALVRSHYGNGLTDVSDDMVLSRIHSPFFVVYPFSVFNDLQCMELIEIRLRSPTEKCHLVGTVRCTTQLQWCMRSSERTVTSMRKLTMNRCLKDLSLCTFEKCT